MARACKHAFACFARRALSNLGDTTRACSTSCSTTHPSHVSLAMTAARWASVCVDGCQGLDHKRTAAAGDEGEQGVHIRVVDRHAVCDRTSLDGCKLQPLQDLYLNAYMKWGLRGIDDKWFDLF